MLRTCGKPHSPCRSVGKRPFLTLRRSAYSSGFTVKQAATARLAEDFLAAAIEPRLWMTALDNLASATGSLRGQLIGIGGPRSVPFNWVTNLPDRATEDFVSIAGGSGRVNYRVAADRVGARHLVKHEAHYEEACGALETDIYLDFCRDYDLPFGCQATVLHREEMLVGLALLRSRRDGRTSPADRQLFASLVPHVKAAVCMQMAMEDQGAALIAGAMEAMTLPAFVLDGLGRVAAVTAGGEAALADGDCVRVADRQIRAVSPADDGAIDAAIAAALSRDGAGQGTAVIRPRGRPLERALLSVARLPTQPMNFGFVPHAIAILRMPGRARAPGLEVLRLAFNLTAAEADVAAALASGRSRAQIAAERGVAPETVKAQLKSLFVKTGVGREAELIAKLTQFGF